MNPDELIKNVESLTRRFEAQQGEMDEESLQELLSDVSQSLNQVFELVQFEIDQGMSKIEEAQNLLSQEGLTDDAESVGQVKGRVTFAKQQLEISQQVASQKRDLELCPTEVERQRLLTPTVRQRFREIARARGPEPSPPNPER